jgi:hypothetical protein
MAQFNTKILKYCEANGVSSVDFRNEVKLKDDGDGVVYIHEWNLDIAEPTAEQLAAQEASANTEESNQAVIKNRQSEYGSNTQQIENIIENGLVAEQARVQAIKDKYPKS